ncbi:MAG: hypothetical protein QRY16_03300 [Enterobacterales bacterium endosymbiont of Blomia tropicalis]|uniref:hypothetical protein n=1 Tax=Mixta mediterraneensis TaxID=2758443 RepID=UPI0025A88693|nr:hypothetical protein [Mixta mediterraneensis]MDL4912841.1 hypothetical protein [Mixta mediterraneensis]
MIMQKNHNKITQGNKHVINMDILRLEDPLILIGEKAGKQARDNGFNYFSHRIKAGFKNTYYIYSKDNIDIKKLTFFKNNIILKDSQRHRHYFFKADYLVINDGYLDVFPTFKNTPLSKGWAPIIYLQHGIISYKKVFFTKVIIMVAFKNSQLR